MKNLPYSYFTMLLLNVRKIIIFLENGVDSILYIPSHSFQLFVKVE